MIVSFDSVDLKCRGRRTDTALVTPHRSRLRRAAAPFVALAVVFTLAVAAGTGDGAPGLSGTATLVTTQEPVPPEPHADLAFADQPETPAVAPVAPAEPPAAPAAAETPLPPGPDACADALAWVADAGLPLPPDVRYDCPSTQFAHHGAACWNGSPCRGSGFIAINMDLMGEVSPRYLRHVVAHEVCHILDFQAKGWTTEAAADACAAAHGAP